MDVPPLQGCELMRPNARITVVTLQNALVNLRLFSAVGCFLHHAMPLATYAMDQVAGTMRVIGTLKTCRCRLMDIFSHRRLRLVVTCEILYPKLQNRLLAIHHRPG